MSLAGMDIARMLLAQFNQGQQNAFQEEQAAIERRRMRMQQEAAQRQAEQFSQRQGLDERQFAAQMQRDALAQQNADLGRQISQGHLDLSSRSFMAEQQRIADAKAQADMDLANRRKNVIERSIQAGISNPALVGMVNRADMRELASIDERMQKDIEDGRTNAQIRKEVDALKREGVLESLIGSDNQTDTGQIKYLKARLELVDNPAEYRDWMKSADEVRQQIEEARAKKAAQERVGGLVQMVRNGGTLTAQQEGELALTPGISEFERKAPASLDPIVFEDARRKRIGAEIDADMQAFKFAEDRLKSYGVFSKDGAIDFKKAEKSGVASDPAYENYYRLRAQIEEKMNAINSPAAARTDLKREAVRMATESLRRSGQPFTPEDAAREAQKLLGGG